MCDTNKRFSTGSGSINGNTISENAFDNISIKSEASIDQIDSKELLQHNQQLHQTTQSLLMASTMLVGSTNNVGGIKKQTEHDQLDHGHYSSANVFGSTDSMNSQFLNYTTTPMRPSLGQQNIMSLTSTMNINIHDLIMENHALREQLKEVAADRDRLLCEVSNLRLELDMVELKRLPEET